MIHDRNKNNALKFNGINLVLRSLKRGLLIITGIFFVGLGIAGIFLPLLPTTVFLLIAAFCFARSSERFYTWLLNNKWFGSYIKNYRDKKGTSLQVKIFSISVLWLTILYSVFFIVQNFYIRIVLALIALTVTLHLLTIRTLTREERKTEDI